MRAGLDAPEPRSGLALQLGRPQDEYRRRLGSAWLAAAAILAIVLLGVAGYTILEGWPLGDSLYMVIITLSTVGFREVRPLSPAGQYLTIFLILTGVATFAYAAASFARLAIEGELRRLVGRRRMDKEIARLEGHFIICGFGRVGRAVARNLRAEGSSIVVIDAGSDAVEQLRLADVPFVQGNAVDEVVLLKAGLPRARGLLLTLSNEADNVYVTLLAKDLRVTFKSWLAACLGRVSGGCKPPVPTASCHRSESGPSRCPIPCSVRPRSILPR